MSEEVVRTVSIPASRVVFADFGKSKVYALASDDDEVLVFNGLEEMIDRLDPSTIVVDNLPSALQKTATEIAKSTTILRLKDTKILAEERKSNKVRKTDENDVSLLRSIYYRHPELFPATVHISRRARGKGSDGAVGLYGQV